MAEVSKCDIIVSLLNDNDANSDIIVSLLDTCFRIRSEEDKRYILYKGRPTPNLSCFQVCENKIRGFKSIWYQRYKWLSGSLVKSGLFCWSCLLVGIKKTVWSDEGYRDWKNLARSLERHSTSKEHIQNDIGVKLLSKQAFSILKQLNEIAESSKKEYNSEVAKYREVFKLLIDLTCLLCKQELPNLGYDQLKNTCNKKNFKEIFNVILANNEKAKAHWEKLGAIAGLSETIQIDIIDCIAEEVKCAIRDIIKGAPFFSIQADEITAWNENAKFSIICCCVDKNGLIKEHFIGFCDRPINRIKSEEQIKTEASICQQILEVLEPFDYPQKLVVQTFDGAGVLSHELNEIQTEIRSHAPRALLLPGLAHHLNLTLRQSCRNIAAVNIFFSSLQGIPAFFHNSTKRTAVLDRIVGKRILTTCEVKWNSNTHIVVTISSEKVKFIEVFQELMNSHDNSAETIREAEAFKNKLSEFDFVFYLLVFQNIFLTTEMVNGILPKRLIDVNVCLAHLSACQTALQDLRNEDTFKKYFEETVAIIGRSPETNNSISFNYQDNFYKIIDNVRTLIKTRFSNISSLKFLQLGNSDQFSNFHYKFPEESLNSLISSYETFFDRHLLRNELSAIYADEKKTSFPQHQR